MTGNTVLSYPEVRRHVVALCQAGLLLLLLLLLLLCCCCAVVVTSLAFASRHIACFRLTVTRFLESTTLQARVREPLCSQTRSPPAAIACQHEELQVRGTTPGTSLS
jgi:hypothetical protein